MTCGTEEVEEEDRGLWAMAEDQVEPCWRELEEELLQSSLPVVNRDALELMGLMEGQGHLFLFNVTLPVYSFTAIGLRRF